MAKNPFKVLGVSETVTQSELDDAYNAAKAPYEEERFYEGERGDSACRKLTELREAYDEATSIISAKYVITDNSDALIAEAEQLLKDGKIDEAQETVNRVTDRNARWHFIQAGIYFKRDWLNDSLAELRQAIALDPNNSDYNETYQHVLAKMNGQPYGGQNGGFYQNRQNGQQDGRSYTGNNNPYQNGYRSGPSACDCCSSLICADCCCECMGGDLIRCC